MSVFSAPCANLTRFATAGDIGLPLRCMAVAGAVGAFLAMKPHIWNMAATGGLIVLTILCLDVGRLVLAPTREASIDAIRIRNAMVAELGAPAQTEWTPDAIPANYNWEHRPAPDYFSAIIDKVLSPEARQGTALDQAVLLARHLRATSHHGNPIQANTRETYEKIISGQGGYCSDYTQAFNALALAAGLKVREWGFTWEDMANGHAFNEIWDPGLRKWVFIDAFTSFYVVDAASGVPMSSLEFRASLLGEPGAGEARVVPIVPERFGFKSPEKALDWYRRGVPQMFLLLGNSVFSYDANPIIQITEPLPRSVEMLVAIVLGEHPRFLFVPSAARPEAKDEVTRLQWQLSWFLVKLAGIVVLACGLLVFFWRAIRARRLRPRAV